MNWMISNLIVIGLVSLANNALFVGFAKIRQRRLERQTIIHELGTQITSLKEEKARLMETHKTTTQLLKAELEKQQAIFIQGTNQIRASRNRNKPLEKKESADRVFNELIDSNS